jgi:hypothetical protein
MKASTIRVLIPIFRLLPFYAGSFAINMWEHVRYEPPLQKEFYAHLVMGLWGVLALTPFILLRLRFAFAIYCFLYISCLGFMLYDRFVPFRYMSPDYHGPAYDSNTIAHSGDNVTYLVSNPPALDAENILMAVIYATPLLLACVYRRYFRSWVASSSNPSQLDAQGDR